MPLDYVLLNVAGMKDLDRWCRSDTAYVRATASGARRYQAVRLLWMAAALLGAIPAPGMAQTEPITTAPPHIIIPNYNGVPAGPLGGLEGSAYVARATDTSASWLNPAGLTKAGTQISGSAGTYKLTTVSPSFLPSDGGSTQQIPNLVGATTKVGRFSAGFALVTTVSWGQ